MVQAQQNQPQLRLTPKRKIEGLMLCTGRRTDIVAGHEVVSHCPLRNFCLRYRTANMANADFFKEAPFVEQDPFGDHCKMLERIGHNDSVRPRHGPIVHRSDRTTFERVQKAAIAILGT